jgi:hypothetical protein
MTQHEFYQRIAKQTGDDLETIEALGFELHIPSYKPDRKESKRQRRLRLWRQQRRNRRLAAIASSQLQS